MSRVGNRKIVIPTGVTVSVDGSSVTIKGPKGELSTVINENITAEVKETEVVLTRKNDNFKNFHGTANANITNMIKGVVEGYRKNLEIIGVGYRFNMKGNDLVISAGYSHPVEMKVPEGIKVEVISNTEISVSGISKELVGEYAANIRKVREPEPYKGKGIRYKDEYIRRKEGKKAA